MSRRGYAFTKRVNDGGRYEMSLAQAGYPSVTDVSEQLGIDADALKVCIVYFEGLTNAQFTALQADAAHLVIGNQTVDDGTGSVTASNYNSTLTQTQVNAFKSWLSTNWASIPAALLSRCHTLAGMTRVNAARAVIAFIRNRQEAGV